MSNDKVRVGISVGDLHGVGLEVILKTFVDPRMLQEVIPIIYGSQHSTNFHRKANQIEELRVNKVTSAEDAGPKKLNLVEVWKEEVMVQFGKPSMDNAKFSMLSLKAATNDLASGKVDVLVTAPIDKFSMKHCGFVHPGHTEYLAQFANTSDVLMIMVSDDLRIGTVTGHIALKDVASTITADLICKKVKLMDQSLKRDFRIVRPKIAVLSIDPHAGDNGAIGTQDNDVVTPAINQLKDEGVLAFGPFPADGFFGSATSSSFDGTMAMYHDQGLVPFKALSFGSGVNYTAGLPIVRTSPVHGTALDIAGQDKADPSSFRNAVLLARDVFRNRAWNKEVSADPLQQQPENKAQRERRK